MQPNSNTKWYIIVGIMAVLLIISVGLNLFPISIIKNDTVQSSSTKAPSNLNQSLFDTQSAVINGKITKVDGKTLTIETKKGGTGTAMASDNVLIMNPSSNTLATPSSDLKKIELNKDVMISFTVINGEYIAQSINYMTPPPAFDPSKLPPVPSNIPTGTPPSVTYPSTLPTQPTQATQSNSPKRSN